MEQQVLDLIDGINDSIKETEQIKNEAITTLEDLYRQLNEAQTLLHKVKVEGL